MSLKPKTDGLEVTSQSLRDELIAIKERLNAIETIESISNAGIVKQYVQDHLKTDKGREIMKECEEPRTRSHLKKMLSFNSDAALDYHLKPLREADLLRQAIDDLGQLQFEWSNLFRRLPKSAIKQILLASKTK